MLFLSACTAPPTATNSEVEEPLVTISDISEKNTVVILATGGTIAGSGEVGKETGYTSGSLSVESLIQAVPQLEDVANIEAIQICNVNSDDITSEIWITLANTINELSQNDNVSGFVITHGTDTLEETAYFLNLTIKTNKPVVLTGSMRPATSISADGPMNLYQAVCLANTESAIGQGVLALFSDKIYSARSVIKTSTYDVMAISAGETGTMGIIRDGDVYWYESSIKNHTITSEFSVADLKTLPKVSIVYFNVDADADADILNYAIEHSDGIVIAGAGAGEFSQQYIEVINKAKIPVVISSRIDDGIITQNSILCNNTVAANNLSPQKAAILLRLALTQTTDFDKLVEIFNKY